MKAITRVSFVLLILTLTQFSLGAQSLRDLLSSLPDDVVDQLVAEEEVFRLDRNQEGIKLLPEAGISGEFQLRTDSLGPDVFTEGLYLIPYPDGKSEIDLEIYNITRKVSAISEVIYKSHRKDAYVPLFDDVYAIDNLKDNNPLPDPLVTGIPFNDSVLMHMKEVNLGSALYETEYIWDGRNLGFFLENQTNLRKIIKVVGKEDMQISMILMPVDEGYLVYGACGIKLSNSNAVYSMMDPYTGFYRRMYAMVTWIYNTMHDTDRLPDLKQPLDY